MIFCLASSCCTRVAAYTPHAQAGLKAFECMHFECNQRVAARFVREGSTIKTLFPPALFLPVPDLRSTEIRFDTVLCSMQGRLKKTKRWRALLSGGTGRRNGRINNGTLVRRPFCSVIAAAAAAIQSALQQQRDINQPREHENQHERMRLNLFACTTLGYSPPIELHCLEAAWRVGCGHCVLRTMGFQCS